MDPLPLHQIVKWTKAEHLGSDSAVTIKAVSKDTRSIGPGDLYLALRGERFDGNRFATEAFAKGCAAAIMDSPEDARQAGAHGPVLLVEDSLKALTDLARAWRKELDCRVLAVTGSSGKTSTKEFAARVLSTKFQTTKTSGNLNNHIGLPLSILAASRRDRAAVWEIGMNHPGEIAPLAELASPDCAIITHIGTAHIEFLKTQDAIALEKGRLAEAVHSKGCVILNADDPFTPGIAARCRAAVLTAGIHKGDFRAENLRPCPAGMAFTVRSDTTGESHETVLPVPGRHMVSNALLAIAAGHFLGVDWREALEALRSANLVAGRLERKTIRGVHFLDDTYNANPDSTEAALVTLREIPGEGRRIAILGKMGELGDHASEGYRRVGTTAAAHADILIPVGQETEAIAKAAREAGLTRIHETESVQSAARMLSQLARPGDIVLVKGSRSAGMEAVFESF